MIENNHTTEPYPRIRHATRDVLRASRRKPMIHSLAEIDVTEVRRSLRKAGKEQGEALSFTAFVISCCARAVGRNPHVHAYRDLRNRLVLFDDVDVSTPVERLVEGKNQVVPTIVRSANGKSVREISRELTAARSAPLEKAGVFSSMALYLAIPPFVRRLVFRLLDRMPMLMKKRAGTMMVTSVGMYGGGAGWGVPVASHTLNVTVGGIVVRPRVVEGHLEEREHLCLTLSFDHDIVDGAPAARYLHRLRRLLEKEQLF